VKGTKPGAATLWMIVAVLGIEPGCATRDAWQQDESRRIAEIVGSEKFSEDIPEVKGTSFLAPESSAPPLPTSKYAIQNRPPQKRSKSGRGNGRGIEVGSSTRAQRASHSKSRHKREEELTSGSAGEDSSSRQP
jgi:hypothetical protein